MNLIANPTYLVTAIFAMAGVTLLTRAMPTLLPKRLLDAPLLVVVNKALPLSVMTLLILTSLPWQQGHPLSLSPLLIAEMLALVVVLISYHWKKQLLLSMLVGIASVNGFLWVLKLMGVE